MKKIRHRKVRYLAQGHKAWGWQSQNLNPGSLKRTHIMTPYIQTRRNNLPKESMLFCPFSSVESEKLSLSPAPLHQRNLKLYGCPSKMSFKRQCPRLQVHGAIPGTDPRMRIEKEIKREGRWSRDAQTPLRVNLSIQKGNQLRKGIRCLHWSFISYLLY